jgi:hypothetical protein
VQLKLAQIRLSVNKETWNLDHLDKNTGDIFGRFVLATQHCHLFNYYSHFGQIEDIIFLREAQCLLHSARTHGTHNLDLYYQLHFFFNYWSL